MIESQSPKGLQLNRFLPPTPVRLLLDSKGNDLAGQVNFDTLQNKLKPLSKDIANKMVKMARPNIEQLIKLGDHKITEIAQAQIREASKLADQILTSELNRLIALKAVNKNIRQVEIDVLEKQRKLSLEELSKASWRLDSLRVIVTNKE